MDLPILVVIIGFYRVFTGFYLFFFPRNLPTFVIIIGLTGFYLVFLLDLAIFVALTKLNEFYWVSPCCFPIDLPV